MLVKLPSATCILLAGCFAFVMGASQNTWAQANTGAKTSAKANPGKVGSPEAKPETKPAETPSADAAQKSGTDNPPEDEEADDSGSAKAPAATGVNLAGQTNTSRGEARRNENIQVNQVDNNAARDANQRVGTTATIVEEYKPERNYFASEFGGGSKGPIHAPAQNAEGFHGNLFWGHNNSVTTARAFFQAGSVQPARQNRYGAAFSTNVWKGGSFSFSGSQDKDRGQVNGNILTLFPDEHTPLATDPVIRATVQKYLDAFPKAAPNRPDISARALNTNSPQSTDTNLANGQLSQVLNRRDHLTLRYTFTEQRVDAFQFVTGQNPDTTNKSHGSRISWNRTWSPLTISDFSIGFDRSNTLLIPTSDALGPIFISGLQVLGPSNNIPLRRALNQWQSAYSVQTRRGRHTISAGGGLLRRLYNSDETDGQRRVYQYRSDLINGQLIDVVTLLRLGKPSQMQQAFGDVHRSFSNWDLHAFAGDRFTVNNQLTLNFGIRWEPTTRPNERWNRSNLPYHSDWNNVGGNFGFAYRLPGNLGVIRSAAATFFSQIALVTYGQDRYNPPASIRLQVVDPVRLENILAGREIVTVNPNTPSYRFLISPDLVVPYSYQYNFSWEGQLAPGWKLQLGYLGSRSHKLFQNYIVNRAHNIQGVDSTVENAPDRRADLTALEKITVENGSNAYYDAGRVTFTLPSWHHIGITSAYWYSKAIDLGADYNATGGDSNRFGQSGQTEFDVHGDLKGLSSFDQPHAFMLQGNLGTGRGALSGFKGGILRKLVNDWDLNTVYLLKSGTPFDIMSGSDGPGLGNVDGTNGDRVDIVDPSILGRSIGNPDTSRALLPRSAFAFIDWRTETRGNVGRNVFRKGKIANLNASLSRSWTLHNEMQLNFRAESINLLNTPQFAAPGNQLVNTNFAQITNTLNEGRAFRFTLRLNF